MYRARSHRALYGKVRRELQAAGYKDEKVALLQPADLPPISALAEVAADMLRKVGMEVDLQAADGRRCCSAG
ncbi:MAG TPA: hypothetical protein VE684_17665 [Crenalkalicoccus sp.]|nr:hypothetical protein [Crenalkalicoccus sp.]